MPTNEEALKEFALWVIQCSFEGMDVEGDAVQEKAVELGLLRREDYDPTKHDKSFADDFGAEPGDPIYIHTELLK